MKANILALLLAALFLAGCNTNLVVSTPNDSELSPEKGIPFSLPKPHVATATYTKLKSGKRCNPITFTKFVSLPSGALYHVNTRPQLFAKSEFTIELNEHGILKKIVFNADPELSETLQSTAGLVTAIAGQPAAAAAGVQQTDESATKAMPLQGLEVLKKVQEAGPQPFQGVLEESDLEELEELMEFLRQEKAEEKVDPSCDTGEIIRCVQPFVPDQVIKECGKPSGAPSG